MGQYAKGRLYVGFFSFCSLDMLNFSVTLSAFVLVIVITMEIQPKKKANAAPPPPRRPDVSIPTEGLERTEWVT